MKIRFRNFEGEIRKVDASEGTSVKDAALQSEVVGIIACAVAMQIVRPATSMWTMNGSTGFRR